MFVGPFDCSIIRRAIDEKRVNIEFINIRDFAVDAYGSVDDHPYGGGQGMILRVDVIDRALSKIKNKKSKIKSETHRTILLDPAGVPYTQAKAKKLSTISHLILICGHYEGVDERIRTLVDEELSIGDYVVTGGEIPAMVVVDSVVRLLPGVLKKSQSTKDESFSSPGHAGLEYPQYTKPQTYKQMSVPPILVQGDHAKIADWKIHESRERTKKRRPDLLS